MTRRAAKVVLRHTSKKLVAETCIDHIEVRRDAYAKFAVWSKKHVKNPLVAGRCEFDLKKTEGIKSPMAVHSAIENAAKRLNVQVEWADAIQQIASIDWLTAAVIAKIINFKIPVLPGVNILLRQRSLRAIGQVTLGTEWGYELHEITLPFERWVRIVGGESWLIKEPYWYEGNRYISEWSFNGAGDLMVCFDGDGVGWEGKLNQLDVLEGKTMDEINIAVLALRAGGQPEIDIN